MAESYSVKITGLGKYLPEQIVNNKTVEMDAGLTAGWCEREIGVRSRRWADKLTQSKMAGAAANEAIAQAGLTELDLDLIINASSGFEKKVPDGGPLLQKQLGYDHTGIPSLTIQSGFQSFISALFVAVGLISAGRYRNILISCSEILSAMLDPSNSEAYCLLGDGAGAIVLSACKENDQSHVLKMVQKTFFDGEFSISSKLGFTGIQKKVKSAKDIAIQMDLKRYRECSTDYTGQVIEELLENFSEEQLGAAILQYLPNTNDSLLCRTTVINTITSSGLCGAASFPMALYDAVTDAKIHRGDYVLLAGTGDGFCVGGLLLQY